MANKKQAELPNPATSFGTFFSLYLCFAPKEGGNRGASSSQDPLHPYLGCVWLLNGFDFSPVQIQNGCRYIFIPV